MKVVGALIIAAIAVAFAHYFGDYSTFSWRDRQMSEQEFTPVADCAHAMGQGGEARLCQCGVLVFRGKEYTLKDTTLQETVSGTKLLGAYRSVWALMDMETKLVMLGHLGRFNMDMAHTLRLDEDNLPADAVKAGRERIDGEEEARRAEAEEAAGEDGAPQGAGD